MRLKSAVRDKIGLSPTQVGFPIARARTTKNYQLAVNVADGMYVAEASCYDRVEGVLPQMDRGDIYPVFLTWNKPQARQAASFAARDLRTAAIRDAHFLVRLEERPPGTLATATVTAFATAFAIWICAALVSAAAENGSAPTDIVAFLLAAPAVFAIALELNLTEGSDRLRSLTGLASLAVSLILSTGAIGIYLAKASGLIIQHPLPGDVSAFFVHDWVWLAVVLLAVINAIWAVTTLGARLVRYLGALKATSTSN